MICLFILMLLLGGAAPDVMASATATEMIAAALWVLCDIELLKLIFGRR